MIILEHVSFILVIILSSFALIYIGIVANKFLQIIQISSNFNFFSLPLIGFVVLSFFILLQNFFYRLNPQTNLLVLLFFFIYSFRYFLKKRKLIILGKILSINIIITYVLVSFSKISGDSALYHYPYSTILNEHKIIFGLNNIHWRFGINSISSYLDAFFLVNFSEKSILISSTLLFSFFFQYLIREYKLKKSNIYNFTIFSILFFILTRFYRFSDYGTDIFGNIYLFFVFIIIIKHYHFKKLKNLNEILLFFSLFIFFQKIFLIIPVIFVFLKILLEKNFLILKKRSTYFMLVFLFLYLIKNFVVSGCYIYPIDFSCTNVKFSSKFSDHANPKFISQRNEAYVKASSKSEKLKNGTLSEENYLKNFNWLDTWSSYNGKNTIKKILPFFILLIFIFIKSKFYSKKKIILKSIEFYILIFSLIALIIWFFKFPDPRYGMGYFGIFIISLLNLFVGKNNKIDFKVTNFFIVLSLIFFLVSNLNRISKSNETFLPTIKNQINEIEIIKKSNDKKLTINHSIDLDCKYGYPICTSYSNHLDDIYIYKNNSYYFISNL